MKYLKGFDGLRAVSIAMVITTHLGIYNCLEKGSIFEQNFNLFSGEMGVKIFFSLSGFLITTLLIKEKNENGSINFKYFFIRRFLRLLPALLVFYLMIIGLMLFGILPVNYVAVAISLSYLYNFVKVKHYTGELGHTWSLAVEEQFYFLWPFVINYFRKIKFLLIVCVLIICFSFFLRYYLLTHEIYIESEFFLNRWFFPACLPIIIGSMFALINFKWGIIFGKYIERNYIFLITALFLFFIQVFFREINEIVIDVIKATSISLILLWIFYNQNNICVDILEFRPLRFLGKISYGLYIYQGLFLRTGPSNGEVFFQKAPINIILTIVVSIVSFYFIEKKFIDLKKIYK